MMTAVLLLLACAPDAHPPDASDSGTSDTGAVVSPRPTWTAADVEAALGEALAAGIPEPWTPYLRYVDAYDHGNSACPGDGHQLLVDDAPCEANGYSYYGIAALLEEEATGGFEMHVASFRILEPDGAVFEVGGYFGYEPAEAGWSTWLDGSFAHSTATGWLAAGASTGLAMEGTTGDATRVVLQGGAQVGSSTVWFEQAATDDAACLGLLSGTVRVRDDAGFWYTVDFGAACASCGAASVDGAALGEVCFDATTAMRALLDAAP